jgi:hypothetical protein
MPQHNGYVRVPPDGTGKKIAHNLSIELDYRSGTVDFVVGNTVVGATSGAFGNVIKIDGTTSSGRIYISLDYTSATAFTDGESLTVNSTPYAVADGTGTPIYKPSVSIVDHENPFRGTNVSPYGELIMSPIESPFSFDSFGSMRAVGENIVGVYHFRYGVDEEYMASITSSIGGTISSSSYFNGIILSNPTTSGSRSKVSSHLYHPYTPGIGQSMIASVICGDTGKAGVVRRWGYYDDNDGLFFELSASVMNVVVRNSSTGTVVETRTPQSQWNLDKVDGSGGEFNISNADLDPSKGTVYFMDFQWLGVGRVRFGIMHSGRRVIVHVENHSQELSLPYMSRPNLPATAEQININTSVSTSELKLGSMMVAQGTHKTAPYIDKILGTTTELTKAVSWTGSFRPMFSTKAAKTRLGKENRSITVPFKLSMYSSHVPILFQVQKWPTLTGDTWTVPAQAQSAVIADATATTASNGIVVTSNIVDPGQLYEHHFHTDNWDESNKIIRKNDINDENCAWTVVAKLLSSETYPSSSLTVVLDNKLIL